MRVSRKDVSSASHALPGIRFEEQELTSFGGLVLLAQADDENLVARLRDAGFEEEVQGAQGPCHRYRFGDTIATLQFVAPLTGSGRGGRKRSSQRDRALRFSGIVARSCAASTSRSTRRGR